ncbi:MAG: DUF192 domain-containing protein [Cyanobium sp.]
MLRPALPPLPFALAATAMLLGLPAGSVGAAPPPQFLPTEARWCLQPPGPPTAAAPGGTVIPGSALNAATPVACIQLEVARTPQQQSWGLMGRPPLAPLQGMWFPYARPEILRFWMHHTPEPLDMVFLRQGRVIAIVAGAAPCPRLPCRSYGPEEPSDGVVELAAGEAARLGLRPGSAALITPLQASDRGAPGRD